MKISGEKSTLAMITLLLVVSFLISTQSVRARPIAPDYSKGWRDEGAPYYFENCWWQRQQVYVHGRPTGAVRNKKISCPGLSFHPSRIVRPTPSPPGRRR
jgi:hypothetical protein